MLNYLLEALIMVSLGLILYLFARALPRLDDTDLDARPKQGMPHWFIEYLERVDEWLLSFAEKMIRRVRLSILKIDNTLSKKLQRFKREPAKETGFPSEANGKGDGEVGSSV